MLSESLEDDTTGTGHRPLSPCQCNPHSEADRDLQKEFCALIMLLTAVTAINNRGHPTLQQDCTEHHRALFDTTAPDPSNVINAVAAILMRDYRAVAAAIPGYEYALNGPDCYVYVIEDEKPQFEGMNFKDRNTTVVATTDPMQHLQTSDNVIITKGISHFDLISDKSWDCLKIS
jgi:hypothetical protein